MPEIIFFERCTFSLIDWLYVTLTMRVTKWLYGNDRRFIVCNLFLMHFALGDYSSENNLVFDEYSENVNVFSLFRLYFKAGVIEMSVWLASP